MKLGLDYTAASCMNKAFQKQRFFESLISVMRRWLFALLFLLNGTLLDGQDLFNNDDDFGAKTKVSLLVEAAVAKPGTTVNIGLHLKMPEGWHTYWKNVGETGEATKVTWNNLPKGVVPGSIQWPVPEKVESFDQFTYAYHHEVLLIIPLQLAKDMKPGEFDLNGTVTWLECEETCLPGEKEVTAKLVVGDEEKIGEGADLFAKWRKHWPDTEAMPELKASWAGLVDNNGERAVRLEVPVESGKIEFLPFGTKDFKWSVDHNSTYERSVGSTVIKKFIKSEAGKWPESIPGVIRVEKDGEVKGYKTAFVFSENEEVATPIESGQSKSIWFILGGAFLGGMILNIMPCVLPVISLKILGFVQQSQETPERVRKLGLTYGLGVLFSFLVLAGMMIAVRQSTGMASWGMQMQNPYFNLVLLLVVALVALNLFGVFEVNLGGGASGKVNELASREGYMGAFFNGLLATALATPCTAPFLAPAMGVALTQSNGVIIASMCAVAAGLAFPFVLLTFQPGWLGFLPKPGKWMVQFKQMMGFPMLAAAIWVLSFTGPMFGKGGVMWLGVLLCVVALAAWVFGEFMQRTVPKSSAPLAVCAFILVTGYAAALEWGLDWRHPESRKIAKGGIEVKAGGIQWKEWNPEAVAEARSAGHPVLIDFTADWCMSCKYTKSRALEVKPVIQKLKELGGIAFLADWTDRDPVITKALHQHQRGAVPLVLVYPPKGEAIVMPPVMNGPGKVLEALDKAGSLAP